MARWYQNVLSGVQIEVKTLDEDDFYQDNSANWCRIKTPPSLKIAKPATVTPTKPVEETPPKKATKKKV